MNAFKFKDSNYSDHGGDKKSEQTSPQSRDVVRGASIGNEDDYVSIPVSLVNMEKEAIVGEETERDIGVSYEKEVLERKVQIMNEDTAVIWDVEIRNEDEGVERNVGTKNDKEAY